MGKVEERPGKVSFLQAWKDFFIGYVDFKGRSTRAGYWWIRLVTIILGFGSGIAMIAPRIGDISANPTQDEIMNIYASLTIPLMFLSIIGLALFLPSLALEVRRMRDVGLRGRGQLVLFGILVLTLIIFMPNMMEIAAGNVASVTRWSAISMIWSLGLFILSVLPTGTLATSQNSGILAFFFKNKKFYEDSEL